MEEKQKKISEAIDEKFSSVVIGIYDNQLKLLKELMIFPSIEMSKPMLTELASSVNSPYYQSSKSYDVYQLFTVDSELMDFNRSYQYIGNLSNFVDENRVKFQRVVQTLNFIPNGFYKMPKEMQDDIKQQIDDAIKTYVQEFVDVDSLVKKVKVNEDTVNG